MCRVESFMLREEGDILHGWGLFVDGQRWMTYNLFDHIQAFELYSHYDVAHGHCICTGLGFGVRENWLLTKPEVTKITVLEKNKEVIEYHQHIKSPMLDHIEVIHVNANKYKGQCDTLLLDHLEYFDKKNLLAKVRHCITGIDHNTLWFWPLELLLTKKHKYQKLRSTLPTLPDLDKETLHLYKGMYNINKRERPKHHRKSGN